MKKYASLAAMLMIVLFVVGLGFTSMAQKAPVKKAPVKGGVTAYTPAPFVNDAWPKVLFVPDDPNAAALPSNWQVVTVTRATLDTIYKLTSDKAKIGGNPGTLYINKDKPDNPGNIKSGR